MEGNLGTDKTRMGGKGTGNWGASTRAVWEVLNNSIEERRVYGDIAWREAEEDNRSRREEYCGDTKNRLA